MRLCLVLALMVLTACAPKREAAVAPEPVIEEAAPAPAALKDQHCVPGDDDGIGGTGCQVD